ncbi:MAG: hypothetical protein OHM77_03570 [Candidatus Nitricoxidivorans perseverans]|uniref:Uncharacterized protein n=1 Tax=Candidatus Nitricoxidivorans perseverans TaxID=2975601 RepID=A0AA49FN97_9PROT|nr:MAG: hypothetical protein OHM77_03570 [Candidatus Nitricoxidivorans perseverans]
MMIRPGAMIAFTMNNPFFEKPILNSPYERPSRHRELDASGQPTQKIVETRRRAEFITPIPKPKKQKAAQKQDSLLFDEGLSTQAQESSSSKHSDLPVGISGPIARTRKGRRVAEYNFGVTIPRHGDKPTNKNVYIGTENTITDERFKEALAKAVDIRKKAERAYQAAATKAKRAAIHRRIGP